MVIKDAVKLGQADALGGDARWLRWGLLLVLSVGILWRVDRYLLAFPMWGDEGYILLNLLDFDYQGLMGQLKYCQVAPILFLWIEKLALEALGASEWAMRLPSMLMGVGALVLFWQLASRTLSPLPALLAVGVFATSYYPMRHSCEVKPYAGDLFASVVLLTSALAWLRHPERLGRLVLLSGLTPFMLLLSYPAVFVAGGIALVLLPTAWKQGTSARLVYTVFGLLLVVTFVGHYALVGDKQAGAEKAQEVHDFMHQYWHDSFPPEQLWRWPAWLVEVHAGNMLAYPAGGKNGASAATLFLCILGSVVIARQRRWELLGICLFPFGLTLIAAILDKYPYGGSARIAQHLAPAICLLMAVGIQCLIQCFVWPHWRTRWGFAIVSGLAGIGIVGIVMDWRAPYKTFHDQEVRRLARELRNKLQPGDAILICNHPVDVHPHMAWYLRQEPCPTYWLGDSGTVIDSANRAWLLNFDLKPGTETRIRSLLPNAIAWQTQDEGVFHIPPENRVSFDWYCHWLLVRNTKAVEP